MEIGYDGSVLRLEGCPKDDVVGGSKMVKVWWVKRRKKTKMMGQDQAWASGQVRTMQWDLAGSSLGDSPKGSGSSQGTRWEITGKRP
ncbi:hypothetical protein B296_00003866 [Ensete ventricosum]|uniref:Uncharacterized protein n=1 Tax=Ensete ventricosum TaxID=4639 RepID=A0A426ZHT7_ENSVE|nr:hypothetical protein B296_00003866 [Ensete ventricosum]